MLRQGNALICGATMVTPSQTAIGDLRISEYLNLRFEPGLHTNKLNLLFNERSKLHKIVIH